MLVILQLNCCSRVILATCSNKKKEFKQVIGEKFILNKNGYVGLPVNIFL